MGRTTVFAERKIEGFSYSSDYGVPMSGYNFGVYMEAFVIELGKEYVVLWDEVEYTVTAQDADTVLPGALVLGDASSFGLGGNGEPFAIGWTTEGVTFFDLSGTGSTYYTVGIYAEEEGQGAAPSATVKIKGYSGAEFTYENVPKVWLAAPESTVDNPVLVPFTYGEAVNDVEIVPDFSAGDQTVTLPDGYMARSAVVKKPESLIPGNIKAGETVAGVAGEYEGELLETEEVTVPADFFDGDMVLEPSEGKYLAKATVQKPDTLIPENIAEGVDIAGIVGVLSAGGSSVKISSGTFSTTSTSGSNITITHDLGVIPDLLIAFPLSGGSTPYNKKNHLIMIAMGDAFADTYAQGVKQVKAYNTTNGTTTVIMANKERSITQTVLPDYAYMGNATETTFSFGYIAASTNPRVFLWIAIAGLSAG